MTDTTIEIRPARAPVRHRRRRTGTPAPARKAGGGRPIDPFTTHRFLMALEASRLGRPRHRLGSRAISPPDAGGDRSPPRRSTPRATARASTSSTTAGRTPRSAPAGATTRSCRSRCPSPRPPAGGCWCGRAPRHGARPRWCRARSRSPAENGAVVAHVTFCTEAEALAGQAHGADRTASTSSIHWQNRGLRAPSTTSSTRSPRASARRSARSARTAQGSAVEIVAAHRRRHRPEHWDAFWRFYQDTGSAQVGRALPHPALLRHRRTRRMARRRAAGAGAARRAARSPARSTSSAATRSTAATGAASRTTPSCISSSATIRRSISRIARGLARVEAGAQGEHKLARGYLPVPTHSLHWIADPGFRARGGGIRCA